MGDPDHPRVLIVGGFATSPPLYLPLARRLRARHVAEVSLVPIWTFDWLVASRTGLGPLGRRTAKAIAREWRAGGRQPLLVIGHSAGGILARLAMSPVPFQGYGTGVGEAVGALVTLGTPHVVTGNPPPAGFTGGPPRPDFGGPSGEAARFLERVLPGAALAPRTGYVTVASTRVPGVAAGRIGVRLRDRFAGELYAGILGEAGRTARGDGIVPVGAAHLDGAVQITLDDVVHGQFGGAPWYGSEDAIDRWWPAARAAWRAAVQARGGPGARRD